LPKALDVCTGVCMSPTTRQSHDMERVVQLAVSAAVEPDAEKRRMVEPPKNRSPTSLFASAEPRVSSGVVRIRA